MPGTQHWLAGVEGEGVAATSRRPSSFLLLPRIIASGMDTSWNLNVLREHIRRRWGHEAEPLQEIVDSLDTSVRIFRYHLFTARDALKGIVDETHSADEALKIVWVEKRDASRDAMIVSEANILGCVHTTRNLYDIFAQLVNRLVLKSALLVDACNIWKVHERLDASDLKTQIGDLLESNWFGYVSAFVNTSKHRWLVRHSFATRFDESVAGIQLGAFEYHGRQYPAYWANEVLTGVLEVKNRIVSCGRILNVHCGLSPDGKS